VFSRKIVGGAMETHLRTELMLAAIDMAITMRKPKEVIHHSDHGCQYTSYAFGKRCQEAGIMPSMGTVGDAYDNAMAESFFATLEREVLNRRRFKSQAEAKMAIFDWLEGWYNPHRRHSALGRRGSVMKSRYVCINAAAALPPPSIALAVLGSLSTFSSSAGLCPLASASTLSQRSFTPAGNSSGFASRSSAVLKSKSFFNPSAAIFFMSSGLIGFSWFER
jgi:integrase-like protein